MLHIPLAGSRVEHLVLDQVVGYDNTLDLAPTRAPLGFPGIGANLSAENRRTEARFRGVIMTIALTSSASRKQ
jgi:hypothetical protein